MKFFYPVSPYFADKICHFRVCRIKLWHHPLVTEAFVIRILLRVFGADNRELQSIEPALFIGCFAFLHHILKCREMPAAMIKYTINNHPDSVGMEGVHQLFKIIICSKAWVNVKIIQQIIFMIFACCKYRINVDGIDAKVFQVIHIFGNALKTASQLSPYHISFKGGFCWPAADIHFSCSKAVRKNVVNNGILRPLRWSYDVCSVIKGKLVIFGAVIHQFCTEAVSVIINFFRPTFQPEIIAQPLIGAHQLHLIIVK